MSLSVCLITRNAENSIERALDSVAGLGAEIIVGDTGSTDRTAEIARTLGAKVLVISWQDDFGAAQNQTLDQATGDGVFWLNPDEELLAEGQGQLPALLARPEALAYFVRVQELRKPDPTSPTVEILQPR